MTSFDLVAFDLYGTLLDISGLAARMRPLLEPAEDADDLLARWRKAQLERTWRLNREARYEPWDQVTQGALEEVAPQLSADTRAALADLWRAVPAYGDAAGTLDALRSSGVRRAILSNGTRTMIEQALEASGLEVDRILSADDVRAYKTDPRVYALLDAEAARDRTLFVSSNGWDVDGAHRSGRPVLWINRGGRPPETAPEYEATALRNVVRLCQI
jgi:2-haloacid dehalogenase